MKISQELVQAILNYLATRPFNEVVRLIGAVEQEVKVAQEEDKKQPKK